MPVQIDLNITTHSQTLAFVCHILSNQCEKAHALFWDGGRSIYIKNFCMDEMEKTWNVEDVLLQIVA